MGNTHITHTHKHTHTHIHTHTHTHIHTHTHTNTHTVLCKSIWLMLFLLHVGEQLVTLGVAIARIKDLKLEFHKCSSRLRGWLWEGTPTRTEQCLLLLCQLDRNVFCVYYRRVRRQEWIFYFYVMHFFRHLACAKFDILWLSACPVLSCNLALICWSVFLG